MSPALVRLQHNSMQFSDTKANHQHDAKAVFGHARKAGAWIVTGTEAGGGRRNHDLRDALVRQAKEHGYAGYFHPYGDWVAFSRKEFHKLTWGFEGPYLRGARSHAPRGITWMSGDSKVGRVTSGACHYLTDRVEEHVPGSNEALIRGIARFGEKYGRGKDIVFCSGDVNTNDRLRDVFAGRPFTTIADELRKWPATHAEGGIIDMISSYNQDRQVRARSYRVLSDRQLHLFSDHFVLEAVYQVD